MEETKVRVSAAEEDEELVFGEIDNVITISSPKAEFIQTSDPFAVSPAEVKKEIANLSSNQKRSINKLEKRFEGINDTGTKQIEDDTVTGYNAFKVISPPYNLTYLSKLYETSPIHYAAVNAKVSNIVGLGYDFVPSPAINRKADELSSNTKKLTKFRQKLAEAKDTMHDLMDSLNTEDTFQEILTKVWRDYEATGNGYIEIGRDINGNIGYLGHVPAATVRVRRDRDGFVQIISNKAVFFRNFKGKESNPVTNDSNPSELIHIKKHSPTNSFYGIPDIISAQQAVAGNKFSSDFNLDYFEHKAVPRHIITLQGATINPRLAKNILEFFETGIKGKNHRSMFVPLPAGTKDNPVKLSIEPVEAGIQDSSFNNYRKSNLGEILMAHRVPISKIGLAEGVSLAVARDADKTFKEQVCQPEQKIFEKKINRVIKSLTDMFLLKLNEMSLTDENTQSQIDERRRKTGTETANEQRARRGLPGLPGGDELFDMNAKAKSGNSTASDVRAEGNRERDAQRSSASTDNVGEGRQTQGEGRTNNVS